MIAKAEMDLSDVLAMVRDFKHHAASAMRESVSDCVQHYRVRFAADRLSHKGNDGVNSRQLRRAIKDETRADSNDITGRVYFRGHWEPVARIHEHGTTGKGGTLPPIRPKRVKWLTIPFPGAYKGTHRGKARRAIRQHDTFVRGYKRGGSIIKKGVRGADYLVQFRKAPKGQKPEPTFLLVKKVELPPRLHFYHDWDKWTKRSGPGWKIIEAGRDRAVKKAMGRF